MPLLRLLAQIHPTAEEYVKTGFVIAACVGLAWLIVDRFIWWDSRYVKVKDYDRDNKEREQRESNDNQRDEKFSKKIDELIQAIKHKK